MDNKEISFNPKHKLILCTGRVPISLYSGQSFQRRVNPIRFTKRFPKDAIYKMIGIGLCIISTIIVFAVIYLTSVNLIPLAIDALIDKQEHIALQAQGVERDQDDSPVAAGYR